MERETKAFALKAAAAALMAMAAMLIAVLIPMYAKTLLLLVLERCGEPGMTGVKALFMTMGALLVPGAMAAWAAIVIRNGIRELLGL